MSPRSSVDIEHEISNLRAAGSRPAGGTNLNQRKDFENEQDTIFVIDYRYVVCHCWL